MFVAIITVARLDVDPVDLQRLSNAAAITLGDDSVVREALRGMPAHVAGLTVVDHDDGPFDAGANRMTGRRVYTPGQSLLLNARAPGEVPVGICDDGIPMSGGEAMVSTVRARLPGAASAAA